MNASFADGPDHPLPPALLKGPELFQKWSQRRLQVEQRAATPTVPLYHYTGERALRGILQNQRPWCFSHLHQSDPNEFEYSLDLARQVLQRGMKREDFFESSLCGCLEDMLKLRGLAGPFDFYLFSLSRHRDDPGQWETYGDHRRGFAIGFGPALLQPTHATPLPNANENLWLGRVLYGNDQTLARHQLVLDQACAIAKRIGHKNADWLRVFRPYPFIKAMAQEVMASQLIWNCLTAKEENYRPEQEVRGIVMGVSERFTPYRKTFNDPVRGDRLYIEHPMELKVPEHVAEIMVGPESLPGSEDMVRDLLRAEGYPDIPIVRSIIV